MAVLRRFGRRQCPLGASAPSPAAAKWGSAQQNPIRSPTGKTNSPWQPHAPRSNPSPQAHARRSAATGDRQHDPPESHRATTASLAADDGATGTSGSPPGHRRSPPECSPARGAAGSTVQIDVVVAIRRNQERHAVLDSCVVQPARDHIRGQAFQRRPRRAWHRQLSTGEMHPPAQDRHCAENYRGDAPPLTTDTQQKPDSPQTRQCLTVSSGPLLVGRVEYREYTSQLRHAAWKGIAPVDPASAHLPIPL